MTRSVEIPDGVVEKALSGYCLVPTYGTYRGQFDAMRSALVAARPYLMPGLDREAVSEALLAKWLVLAELKIEASPVEHSRSLADAVMELARPMPTLEQIEDVVTREVKDHVIARLVADAVLALLNGES